MKLSLRLLLAAVILLAFYAYGEYVEGSVRYEHEVYANRAQARTNLDRLDSLIQITAQERIEGESHLVASEAELERLHRWQFGRTPQERYEQIQEMSEHIGRIKHDLRLSEQQETALLQERDRMEQSFNYYDRLVSAVGTTGK